jgi:3-oxoadipate enol-lactonase
MVKAGAVELACRIDGDAGKPWLILSNSLATDHSMWSPQMDTLTRSHQVLRYDTRGHGQSAAPPPPYSLDDLVGDVIALMDVLEIETADFMGLSLGGMTGLGLALDHADRIKRLVCCDARADAPEPYRKMWPANIDRAREQGMDALVEPTLERWFSQTFRFNAQSAPVLSATGDMIRRTSVDGYAGCASALMGLDYHPRLGEIGIPTLYVVGETDPAAPQGVMKEMAELTPGAEFFTVQQAAHLSNLERPDLFNQAVGNWLDGQPVSA